MQLWMNAMLAVSAVLIIRDMAKFFFTGKKKIRPIYDANPQKEHMEQYARSFQKLAHTFYELPARQKQMTSKEIKDLYTKVRSSVCSGCPMEEICWKEKEYQTCQRIYELLTVIEEGTPDQLLRNKSQWLGECSQAVHFTEEIEKEFYRLREELIYRNQLTENRLAVAEQLNEVSYLLQQLAGEVTDLSYIPWEMEEKIKKHMQKQKILVKQVWLLSKKDEKLRIFLTMRTRAGQCVTMKEAARQLSAACGRRMIPSKESRTVLNSELKTVLFIEDVTYQILYGAARATKEKETISGDNFTCSGTDEQFLMCLSDGMGSGVDASRESESVVELLEQFVTAGFSRESAARMVNSALVLQRKDGMFSSVDMCSVNLYTGVCEFLKAGAATTFIKRSNWIETITSSSMAAGLMEEFDFEKTSKKLYDGDYVVMVTDGVLDALPPSGAEEIMKEILLSVREAMPKEMGRYILEKVLSYSDHQVKDDMTVLVAGMWKK